MFIFADKGEKGSQNWSWSHVHGPYEWLTCYKVLKIEKRVYSFGLVIYRNCQFSRPLVLIATANFNKIFGHKIVLKFYIYNDRDQFKY